MIKRILVGISDRMYSLSATYHAVEVAKQTGASLTAVSVIDYASLRDVGPTTMGSGPFATELRRERLQLAEEVVSDAVDAFERICVRENVPHQVVREDGDPLGTFIQFARYHDLAVVGLHRLFEHGVVEDPIDEVERLVSGGVRPLLAVAPEFHPIRRVLIAYSGSAESARTIRQFAQLHHMWDDLTAHVVHFGREIGSSEQMLRDTANYLSDHGLDATTEAVDDSPKRLLAYAADWDADLIVMGNSNRNLLMKRVFGDTALLAIRESAIPLFLSQ